MKATLIVGTKHGAMVVTGDEPDDGTLSFAGVLQSLYDQRYTGPITIHFKDGKPSVLDLPSPKIRLV